MNGGVVSGKDVTVDELMTSSGVAFGTSGVRGLATAMTDEVCFLYTMAFLDHLEELGELRPGDEVVLGGDLRPSTDRILGAAARAVEHAGFRPLDAGRVPSPALALYGFSRGIPSIMVTGSHIPSDRNGIKFTRPGGEILKTDETSIRARTVTLPPGPLRAREAPNSKDVAAEVRELYVRRYLNLLPPDCLRSLRVGVYQHSAVGRDLMVEVLEGLGVDVVALGRSEDFVPVDTEAIRQEDVDLAAGWAVEHRLDAIVSTDGDSDRPLISDERGRWLRGDIAALLAAAFIGADTVATPVSCNTAVERCGLFARVIRTRIGSPYVIAAMERARSEGAMVVAGYEANGGFLLGTATRIGGRRLAALPTRDALIVQLAILASSVQTSRPISRLVARLPRRYTASDKLADFPSERARARLGELYTGDEAADRCMIAAELGRGPYEVTDIDGTDGLRVTLDGGEIVHVRPSGNAPELRCYSEADTEERAVALLRGCLEILEGWR
jgi:phosphomannomutase